MRVVQDFIVGLRLAIRARYLLLAGSMLIAVLLCAFLAGLFSARHPSTLALDVGISAIRLLAPLVLVLMAQELISREFDRRYFLGSLTYPRSRYSFILGRFLAVVVLGLCLLLLISLCLGILVWLVSKGYAQATPVALGRHYLVTIGFIGVDLLLLGALASFLAVVASTPSFVLIGTFGFMLVARSFSSIIELLGRDAWVVGDAESYRAGVGLLSYLLPDLGALDMRMVALYGKMELLPSDWPWLLLSCLAYIVGLLALAVWALQRKRFV